MRFNYFWLSVVLLSLFAGCESDSTTPRASTSQHFETQVNASLHQYFHQINTYSENPVLAEELTSKSVNVFLPAAAEFITSEEKNLQSIHAQAQDILLRVKGTPAESTVGKIIGLRMLTWVIPSANDASEEMKLDYVSVLNRNVSDEFLVIAQTLKSSKGDPLRIKQEASIALANMKALEIAHSEEIEELEKLIRESDNADLVNEAKGFLKEAKNDWPPRVDNIATRGKMMLDVEKVQALLKGLAMS